MNKITIIGNLTKDPELRTTPGGNQVCSFTVAVNRRRKQEGQPDADFFRVNAWNQLGQNCSQYLAKGRKVAVVGAVSIHSYTGNDGQQRSQLEVLANDVEFLSPKSENEQKSAEMVEQADRAMTAQPPEQVGFTEVQMPEEDLPF